MLTCTCGDFYGILQNFKKCTCPYFKRKGSLKLWAKQNPFYVTTWVLQPLHKADTLWDGTCSSCDNTTSPSRIQFARLHMLGRTNPPFLIASKKSSVWEMDNVLKLDEAIHVARDQNINFTAIKEQLSKQSTTFVITSIN